MKSSIYCSWISLVIFIGLIIFIPYKVSLFGFKASDVWLILCVGLQYAHGYNARIEFPGRKMLVVFGIVMAFTAIIGTVFQAWQDEIAIDPSYFSEFYRFFRYFLIFKFVENIIIQTTQKELQKFFYYWTLLGVAMIILSFLEFYSLGPVHQIILQFYFIVADQSFDEYIEEFGRLLGVLGNSNSTAIFLTSTVVFPAFILIFNKGNLLNNLFSAIYILLAGYVIVVMTSSRTSIVASIFILFVFFVAALTTRKNLVRLLSYTMALLLLSIVFFMQFKNEIKLPDRVTYFFEGKSTRGEKVGIIESMGRNELWRDRIRTFEKSAHPAAFLTGMGYTKRYKEYSDNGLLSSFFNNGLIGLFLRLILYFMVFRYCVWQSFMNFRKSGRYYLSFISGIITLVFTTWELTADMVEHIKLGQIFYLFFSFTFLYNAKYFGIKRNTTQIQIQNPVFSLAEN